MSTEPKKFNLTDQDNTLKIYFFTVQKGRLQINVPEDTRVIMAYNDDDAINEVRKLYPAGTPIVVNKRNALEVFRVVDNLNLPKAAAQEVKPMVEPAPAKEKTVNDFVYGMSLLADKYIRLKKDRETVKKILNKIKVK